MTDITMFDAAATVGAAMEQTVSMFMMHPETFGDSVAAGYQNPLAGYVAGRGGVLGEATGTTVSAVFAVFEPHFLGAMWEEGIAVRGAAGASDLYWEQTANFARKYLRSVEGLARIAALGEKLIAVAPVAGLPLYAGWRTMPLADDDPARSLQVMFVLRELRAGVHFNALTVSDIAPIEAHMLNKGHQYAAMFGWPEPFADGAEKVDRYAEVEQVTNRRLAQFFAAALEPGEAEELSRLCAGALATLQANLAG